MYWQGTIWKLNGANQDLPWPFSPLPTALCQHHNPPFWTAATIITCSGLGKNIFLNRRHAAGGDDQILSFNNCLWHQHFATTLITILTGDIGKGKSFRLWCHIRKDYLYFLKWKGYKKIKNKQVYEKKPNTPALNFSILQNITYKQTKMTASRGH